MELYAHAMLKVEIDKAVEESSSKLLKISIAPVRRWLLEYVLCKDREDTSLQRAIAESEHYPPRIKLLETLREDGTWPIPASRKVIEDAGPGPPYGWTSVTILRNLYMLYEYCATRDTGRIDAAVERILGWQDEAGYIRGPELDTFPRVYHNGLALGIVARYGRENDPRADALVRWLLKTQRRDGGWNIPYLQDVKYLPEYKHMRVSDFIRLVNKGGAPRYDPERYYDVPSCIWSTVGAIRGLAWIKPQARNPDVKRACGYVLDNFFKRNYHGNFNRSERSWTVLKFPTYFGSGLTALDSLIYLGMGPEDERMERPMKWLLGARAADGFWYRSERPHPIDDQWVTVTALMILKYYSDMY